MIILVCSCLVALKSLDLFFLDKGIALYGGFFHATPITQTFHIFMFFLSAIILQLTAFYPIKVWIKNYASFYSLLFKNITYDTNIVNKMGQGQQFRIIEYPLIILFIIIWGTFLLFIVSYNNDMFINDTFDAFTVSIILLLRLIDYISNFFYFFSPWVTILHILSYPVGFLAICDTLLIPFLSSKFYKMKLFFIDIVYNYYYVFCTLCKLYPRPMCLFVNLYTFLLFIVLYNNDMFINNTFAAFTVSIITIIYAICIDKTFSEKHPYLFKLLMIICSAIVLFCFFVLIKFLIYKIKDIIEYILKVDPKESPGSAGYNKSGYSEGADNRGPDGNGPGKGPSPGGNDSTVHPGETNEQRKKRLARARAKEWAKNNREKVKANKKKYSSSQKGKQTQSKWEQANSEAVKSSKRKYNISEKGKKTILDWQQNNPEKVNIIKDKYDNSEKSKKTKHDYYENNKEYLKDNHKGWAEENKDNIEQNNKLYYEKNKQQIKDKSKNYYETNKDQINSKRRKTNNDPFYDILEDYSSYKKKKGRFRLLVWRVEL